MSEPYKAPAISGRMAAGGMTPASVTKAIGEVDEALARWRSRAPRWHRRYEPWLVDVPLFSADGARVEHFVVSAREAANQELRAAFNPQRSDRSAAPGTYTRLVVDGRVWMSDTPAECRDLESVDAALAQAARTRPESASALIVGLGLGVVVNRAIHHRVPFIDVVEVDRRLVPVAEHYQAKATAARVLLGVHWADIHAWRAPQGCRWDVAWYDIWPTISDADLPEVERLRRRFRARTGWQGAWAQDERLAMRRRVRKGWAY